MEIKFYFTSNCKYCEMALKYLKDIPNIQQIDASKSSELKRELMFKTYSIIFPTLIKGNHIIEGFNKKTYEELFSK